MNNLPKAYDTIIPPPGANPIKAPIVPIKAMGVISER
jgi:hypothetical protein